MAVYSKTRIFVALLFVLAFSSIEKVQADPLTFSNVVALQNNGSTRVDLFSNPGTTLVGPQVSFLVDISGMLPAGGLDTLRITYTEAGRAQTVQSFQIPAFGTVQPPFTLIFSVASWGSSPQGVLGSLTVDLLQSSPDFVIPGGPNAGQRVDSYTYLFRVAQPVPEPATILTFGTALVALAGRARKKRQKD
jgi:hypothetical protein